MGTPAMVETLYEWDWRSVSEDDDQGDNENCTTSDDDELVIHLLHLWTTFLFHFYTIHAYLYHLSANKSLISNSLGSFSLLSIFQNTHSGLPHDAVSIYLVIYMSESKGKAGIQQTTGKVMHINLYLKGVEKYALYDL